MVSAQESRNQCIKSMGADLGAMYYDLNDQLLETLLLWKQYEQLFCVDQATVQVLNDSARTFFGVVQAQFWDAVMLGISRLTDPAMTGKKPNLSISAIPPIISDLQVRAQVESAVAAALIDAEFAREHRNKRIAHNDLVHIQGLAASPLSPASRLKIKAALSSVCAVLEILNGHYRQSVMLYDDLIYDGGAGSVVHLLENGLRHQDCDSAE